MQRGNEREGEYRVSEAIPTPEAALGNTRILRNFVRRDSPGVSKQSYGDDEHHKVTQLD